MARNVMVYPSRRDLDHAREAQGKGSSCGAQPKAFKKNLIDGIPPHTKAGAAGNVSSTGSQMRSMYRVVLGSDVLVVPDGRRMSCRHQLMASNQQLARIVTSGAFRQTLLTEPTADYLQCIN